MPPCYGPTRPRASPGVYDDHAQDQACVLGATQVGAGSRHAWRARVMARRPRRAASSRQADLQRDGPSVARPGEPTRGAAARRGVLDRARHGGYSRRTIMILTDEGIGWTVRHDIGGDYH